MANYRPPEQNNTDDNPEEPSTPEMGQQLLNALEQFAVHIPPEVEEQMAAGETAFHFHFRSNIFGHTLNSITSGKLGRVNARSTVRTTRLVGEWHVVTPNPDSFIQVNFRDIQGVTRIGKSDSSNWIILQRFYQTVDDSIIGSLSYACWYRG